MVGRNCGSTWEEDFALTFLRSTFREIVAQYTSVDASVENVPTHLAGVTPFELVRESEWITLDLQRAALYDELDRFESVRDRIANVHLRGRLEGSEWVLSQAPFGFYEALDTIRNQCRYSGVLTMEASMPRDSDWEGLVAVMVSLRRQ